MQTELQLESTVCSRDSKPIRLISKPGFQVWTLSNPGFGFGFCNDVYDVYK